MPFDPLVRPPSATDFSNTAWTLGNTLGNLPDVFRQAQEDQIKLDTMRKLQGLQLTDAQGNINPQAYSAMAQILAPTNPAVAANLLSKGQEQQDIAWARNVTPGGGGASGATAGAPPAPVSFAPQVSSMVDAAATQYGVDPGLYSRLINQESGGNPNVRDSPAGAQGIAQFMPGTAREYGVNPRDPQSSISGGARYLRDMIARFGGNVGLGVAAYNWGPEKVEAWVRRGAPPGQVPGETRNYVRNITGQDINSWASQGTRLSASAPPQQRPPGAPQLDAQGNAQGNEIVDRSGGVRTADETPLPRPRPAEADAVPASANAATPAPAITPAQSGGPGTYTTGWGGATPAPAEPAPAPPSNAVLPGMVPTTAVPAAQAPGGAIPGATAALTPPQAALPQPAPPPPQAAPPQAAPPQAAQATPRAPVEIPQLGHRAQLPPGYTNWEQAVDDLRNRGNLIIQRGAGRNPALDRMGKNLLDQADDIEKSWGPQKLGPGEYYYPATGEMVDIYERAARANMSEKQLELASWTQIQTGKSIYTARSGLGDRMRGIVADHIGDMLEKADVAPWKVAGIQQDFQTGAAGKRILQARAGNLTLAESEANKFLPNVDATVAALDRTRFPTLNSVIRRAEIATGDPREIEAAIAIRSFVATYARVLKPTGGVIGVHDMEEATKLLDPIWSKGQITGAMKQFGVELKNARSALNDAFTQFNNTGRWAIPSELYKTEAGRRRALRILAGEETYETEDSKTAAPGGAAAGGAAPAGGGGAAPAGGGDFQDVPGHPGVKMRVR
jgi:soluble lytic murein transglycosylase-like protein